VQVPTLTSGTDTDLYFYEDINQPDQDYRLISEANDIFTAASGSAPDHTRWRIWPGDEAVGTSEIQSNQLRHTIDSTSTSPFRLTSRYEIEGDFDLYVDFSLMPSPPETGSDYWEQGLLLYPVGYTDKYVGNFVRWDGSNRMYRFRYRNGLNSSDDENTTDTSGKLRLVRSGSNVSAYRWTGGMWDQIGSTRAWASGDVTVQFHVYKSMTGDDVYMDYDNFTVASGTVTGFVGDTNERPAMEVWDNYFETVYHMAQEPSGTDDILDSTSNTVSGTSQNMEAADLKDGQVGKALEFDGTAEWVDMGDVADTDPGTGELTVEILAKRNVSGIDDYFVSKGNVNSTLEGWSIWQENSTNALYVRCNASDSSAERASQNLSGGILDTNWHTVALVLDHTDETIYGYKDGSNSGWAAGGGGPADDDITGFDIDTTDELAIAAARDAAATSRYANATIDEVRISSTARTPGWISMTHDSLFDDLVFYDLLPPAPPTPPEPPTPSGLADAEGCATVNDVLTSGIVVRLYRRSDGSLVGEATTNASGTWNIPTTYSEYHYAIGLYPVSGTNALIYDWLYPTTVS
jgi:hypothetical protein